MINLQAVFRDEFNQYSSHKSDVSANLYSLKMLEPTLPAHVRYPIELHQYANWSIANGSRLPVYVNSKQWQSADLISTMSYNWHDQRRDAHCLQLLSQDLDLKGSDPSLVLDGRLDRTRVIGRIQDRMPSLLGFIHALIPTRTGLSLQTLIMPVILNRPNVDIMLRWVREINRKLSLSLKSIGINADLSHNQASKMVANVFHREPLAVDAFLKARERITANQEMILSELHEILKPFQAAWTRSKQRHAADYLHVNARIERRIAAAYLAASRAFPEGFCRQMSYRELRDFLGVSDYSFRQIRRGKSQMHWLSIQRLGLREGYEVIFKPSNAMKERAHNVSTGLSSKSLSLDQMPEPESLSVDERYSFASSVILSLKRCGCTAADTLSALSSLRSMIPFGSHSKTFRTSQLKTMVGYFFKRTYVSQPIDKASLPSYLLALLPS